MLIGMNLNWAYIINVSNSMMSACILIMWDKRDI